MPEFSILDVTLGTLPLMITVLVSIWMNHIQIEAFREDMIRQIDDFRDHLNASFDHLDGHFDEPHSSSNDKLSE